MVYAIIISDLKCQVLYSSVFNFHENFLEGNDLINIVQKIKTEFDFNFATSSSNSTDVSNASVLDFETKGVTNIKVKNYCKTVVYHSFCGCLYILICDNSDNRLLAYRTLVLLIRTLRDILPKITSDISQVVVRADAISMAVSAFIPSGQLLYLHDQAMQQISRDLQKALRN